MNFLYENVNTYGLINYYKEIHEYYMKNKEKVYNILKGLTNELIIEETKEKEEVNDGDFSNFYFFYIQTLKPVLKRKNFKMLNIKQIHIRNDDDFLVGLNFSKCKIGSDIRIILNYQNIKKKIFRILITKENKDKIFLPINNKNFFPFFLSNLNTKLIIQSNNSINEIDTIYLKLHQNYTNKFFNIASYIVNLQHNTYLDFSNLNIKLYFSNDTLHPNEFMFYFNMDKYYGRKIFNYIKKYKIKKYIKELLLLEYNLYDDISTRLCKFI